MSEFPVDFENRVASACAGLSKNDRLFFIHVPKTAGTAVKWRLEKNGIETYHTGDPHPFPVMRVGHLTTPIWARVNRQDIKLRVEQSYPIYQGRWEKMLKFSLTRNPFSWLTSWYLHGTPETEDGWGNVNYIYGIRSFAEFVEKFCCDKIAWNHAVNSQYWNRSMYAQWFDRECDSTINFAIRSEHVHYGLDKLLSAAGLSNMDKPPRANGNYSHRKTKDYKEYYDSASKEIVEKYFARELEIFGYNFDGPTDDRVIYDVERMHLSYNLDSDLFMHKGTQLQRG